MARTGRPPHTSKQRVQLIEGLRAHGGTIVAESGKSLGHEDIRSLLGVQSTAVGSLLHRAQVDGVITREVNGRRTISISLVDGAHLPAPKKKSAKKPTEKRAYTRRAAPQVELPVIGDQVTVNMVSMTREGIFQLGLRSDTGSWIVTVNGFAAVEAIE